MENIIAERSLLCQSSDGQKTPITIQISQPSQEDEHRWKCQIAVLGLYEDRPVIEGVDSFQALNLAFTIVRQGLEQFQQSGGKLFWRDGSGELAINDIFA